MNVDHVATLRQARRAGYPDPVVAAALAELAGADQITVHLREDRRHIQERDLNMLRQTVHTRLNLEMAAVQPMVQTALEVKPDEATLVPERREELTTEGGLDVVGQRDSIRRVARQLRDGEILTSLFIDPDAEQVKASHKADAQVIEIHTGRYCDARGEKERQTELSRIVEAAKLGRRLGLKVAAGHGLSYENVRPIVAVEEIEELNIGHAIVARAVLVGMQEAVGAMLELLKR